MTPKQAYRAWVKRMDPHWKHNYPKWKNLSPHMRKSWTVAVDVIQGES